MLVTLGHQTANITKALFHSPFLYLDRNEGKRNYRFIILETFSFLNSYNKTKDRLEEMEGTDLPASVSLRREQNILREWLFKEKETGKCSICGKLYSVRSLVCAHKKKRSSCTEEERTDPYIVMPICLFGCDIMYENEYLGVVNGEVVAYIEELTESERHYVTQIEGRKLDSRWLEGKMSYFDRN